MPLGTMRPMESWIIIVALYAVGMGLFHFLGGLRSAGKAFERWGAASSSAAAEHASPSA